MNYELPAEKQREESGSVRQMEKIAGLAGLIRNLQ
jgi:hypothetical protein